MVTSFGIIVQETVEENRMISYESSSSTLNAIDEDDEDDEDEFEQLMNQIMKEMSQRRYSLSRPSFSSNIGMLPTTNLQEIDNTYGR